MFLCCHVLQAAFLRIAAACDSFPGYMDRCNMCLPCQVREQPLPVDNAFVRLHGGPFGWATCVQMSEPRNIFGCSDIPPKRLESDGGWGWETPDVLLAEFDCASGWSFVTCSLCNTGDHGRSCATLSR
eukprot:189828-Amphidinium_carterae.1